MRICGLDPGLQLTGYGVITIEARRARVLQAGTIRSDEKAPLSTRLLQIYTDLCDLLEETQPDLLAVENIYTHYKHPQTAVLMGHARGIILLAAARQGIAVREHAATHIKRSLTGNGRAGKAQVQTAIRLSLGLARTPEPHDVADALAVALCEAAPTPGRDLRSASAADVSPHSRSV